MLSLELSINIVVLLALMTVAGLGGFALKRWSIVKIRTWLFRVENELIRSHKEILELQKECLIVEQQLRRIRNPAIAQTPSHNMNDKKLPNVALRKKLLTNV